jgi:hypothetical protein
MANAAYPLFLDSLWNGQINIGADTFRISLISNAYTYSAADQFFSAITGVLATATLANLSSSGGVFAADDCLVTGPIATPTQAVVVYKWTGSAATSRLALYLDTGVGFQVTESGDVNVIFSKDTTARIFPLGGRP